MEFQTILNQMGILVLIMLVGFVCAKLGVTGPAFNRSSNGVVMNVLLVCTILASSMTSTLDMDLLQVLRLVGYSTLVLAVSTAVGLLIPRLLRIPREDSGVAFFAVMMMNSVFVAFPVIQAMYGADGIFYASMSNIPFNLLAYTVGAGALRGDKGGTSFKKALTPPLVATLVGVAILLSGIRMPSLVVETCSTIGKATVPMSMLVIGTSLGGVPLRAALSDWKVYVISLVRLLVCPVLTWLVLRLFISDSMTLGVFTVLACAPSAMLVTVLAIQYGKNEKLASQCVFISTVLSAVTMPLLIWALL